MIAQFKLGPVRALDLKELWLIGRIQQLRLVRETFLLRAPLRDWGHLLLEAWGLIHIWLNQEIDNEHFEETHKHGRALLGCINRIMSEESFPPGSSLPLNEADNLVNLFDAFDSSLTYELGRVPSYVLEEKRGYSVGTLIEKAYKTISARNTEYLSEFTKQNIKEAGRCFVFDCFTATGFHITRALESVARRYFKLVTGREPFETKKGNLYPHGLGRISRELRDKLDTLKNNSTKQTVRQKIGGLGTVVAFLEQICLDRDGLAHPDIIAFDEDQAADVFFQALNAISSALNDVRAGGTHFAEVIDLPKLKAQF